MLHKFEARGITPPSHLAEFIRDEILFHGDVVVADRVGLSRTALTRVAARLPVTRGSIALVNIDFQRRPLAA
jgi:hypothetical protein